MSNESQTAKDQRPSISPMLSVRNGAKAVEFYKAAFGAGELFRIEDERGAVVARLSVGESEFWVADESPEHKNFSRESLGAEFRGGATVRMVMVVADPDAAFARAVKAGATVVWPVIGLANQRQGIRLARRTNCRSLRTPLGNRQAFGRRLTQ